MLTDQFPTPTLRWHAPFSALQAELPALTPLRAAITANYRRDEAEAVQWLLAQAKDDDERSRAQIDSLARRLVEAVRARRMHASGVDALMHEFSLSSEEGIALMCVAEALLRIPDTETADRLIADKLSRGDWRRHLGGSPSLFVNAAAWSLLITGKLVATQSEQGLSAAITRMLAKGGEPLIRKGVDLAMRMLGKQFVTGETIAEAIANSREGEARGYRYSYDMLGEAALTAEDAVRYCAAYESALHAIGKAANGRGIRSGPGISVKLSALHPRYARAQRARVMQELLPRLKKLALLAKRYDIGLNIDAEEADRLDLSLDLLEALACDADLSDFDGIGFVVQAYQKRCPFVIDYVADLARRSGRKFMVRLVKGAYWDSEIKRAQVDGLPGYPVYTRKPYTDVSYLICAQKLLRASDVLYPQFATHNAHTLSAVYTWAEQLGVTDYEFQCLHGMGETLYDQVIGSPAEEGLGVPCRIYAPVGSHQTLLAYLVRRLLENGANTSFVNRIVDEAVAIDELIADPCRIARSFKGEPHPEIPLPPDLLQPQRKNAGGIDLTNEAALHTLASSLLQAGLQKQYAAPIVGASGREHAAGHSSTAEAGTVVNPADRRDTIGHVTEATPAEVEEALATAADHAMDWQTREPVERAALLENAADLFEAFRDEFIALAVREAGKSIPNAIAEVREAVDFLRYYAQQSRAAQEQGLPHALAWGPIACISPWNFPLAIFTGQIAAALAAGNVALAKPAEQTPLIAHRAVQLLHEAGIPNTALQFLPGRGETIGAQLVADPRTRGVIFTGSTEVAQSINRALAQRMIDEHCEIPLIAETGGQNAMIVDSSALPEQVVQDVLVSAFDSAGQRCSALRVLCLQHEIADKVLHMLHGAMQELYVGNPDRLSIDIGPVIDAQAQQGLLAHIERMKREGKPCHPLSLDASHADGTYVAPTVIEIGSLSDLTHEVFGPVLHVLRYRRDELPQLVEAINATGYGLTLGIHSRIDETINAVSTHAHVGNIYVNRTMVGAVVGVQPFGGEGKSGTGPKAGGPLYLWRLQRNPLPWFDSACKRLQLPHEKTPALIALDALEQWARSMDNASLYTLISDYRRDSLLGTTLLMPGPTGERNTLSFKPRGAVLCAADTRAALLNQLAAGLACGNTLLISQSTAALLPPDLPGVVRDAIHVAKWNDGANQMLQLALVESSQAAYLHEQMAERDGAIVPVVEMTAEQPIALWRMVAERALSINTTAAGGNASLMSLRA
ncbi:trifunctional transcriptional regulator/proline dehydrogenase/L-glutamate gamma-semialdehyde dehydrogenase [Oxalobacteraceae bacterium R-40]|uniref:Bifunctional protein PutA n=1 Tax=Keguizhuia sedimenti TaxID=3064264 RepID=A0ABU1BKP7_9BURK|nr:trifunctional transcriptional regulator/proline dehydrogenase/L-glutamate gamma-semialdehyde dehydrogenase [Oxalobacteraceae bacterium R-40]